jgi:hypothetical protein
MNYNPTQAPLEDEEVKDWIELELTKISMAINEQIALDKSYALRGKVFDGRLEFFDKSASPDGHTGVFVYYDKDWHRIG